MPLHMMDLYKGQALKNNQTVRAMMMRTGLMIVVALSVVMSVAAHPTYTGFSGGEPGRMTCAMSCHGPDGASVSIQGFPSVYVPGQTYTLSVFRVVGDPVSNFNASVRIGTGFENAGVLGAGLGTSIYDTTGETNGVHFTNPDQDSGSFTWTAPPSGTGTVRLYGGAHQGNTSFGPNTEFLRVAQETPAAPGPATNPFPADLATGVPINIALSWTADTAATSHDVRFGTTNPPDSVTNVTSAIYSPGNLQPGTVYYWRIDERNDAGVTPGTVWQFTTATLPGAASNPDPADSATGVAPDVILTWTIGQDATSHDIYFGSSNPPTFLGNHSGTSFDPPGNLTPGTTYFWQIDERNSVGVTPGPLWRFTVQPSSADDPHPSLPQSLALGPAYPNPFNSTLTIPFVLPQAADVTLSLYDITGRQVAVLTHETLAAGAHRVEWSSSGVGSGIYFLKLSAGSETLAIKVAALK
jgi:hypothetical protein